jgi:hypothetical protein
MANMNGFDANAVEPQDFSTLPAGKYVAAIVESEHKTTKDGKGSYLMLVFEIIEGQFKSRRLWHNLNLQNVNKQAVDIARASLSSICRAVGVMVPKDSLELHKIPLVIDVKCRKNKETGDIENTIRGFAKKDGSAVQPEASSSSPAPWKR